MSCGAPPSAPLLRTTTPSEPKHCPTPAHLALQEQFFFLKLQRLKCCISAVCSLCCRSCSVAFSSSCPGQHHQTGPTSPANNTVLYGACSIHRDSFNSFSLAQLCIFVLLLWHSSFLSNRLVKICRLNAKTDIFIKKRHFQILYPRILTCQICSIYLYIKKKKHHLWSVFSFSLTAVLQISVIQIFWCPLFSKI